jgi:hypothetical protein
MQKAAQKLLLSVFPIKLFKDNYSYLLVSSKAPGQGALVDPADPPAVISYL